MKQPNIPLQEPDYSHAELERPKLTKVPGRSVIRFALPWPHKDLSQNSRCHWAVRSRLTKSARGTAYYLTRAALGADPLLADRLKVHLAFAPPDRRRRDAHNLAGSMKGAIDGIADAVEIDDSRFIVSHELLDQIAGEVYVTLEAA